jgi:hypothetical protein
MLSFLSKPSDLSGKFLTNAKIIQNAFELGDQILWYITIATLLKNLEPGACLLRIVSFLPCGPQVRGLWIQSKSENMYCGTY